MSTTLSHPPSLTAKPAIGLPNDAHHISSALAPLASGGACCTFEWQTACFRIVEVCGFAPVDAVATFAIAGRLFAVCVHDYKADVPADQEPDIRGVLTPREVQVVGLVANGLRNKQIAVRLQLSEFTIAAYVKQICRKLEVNNRTAMVSSCVQRFGVKPSVN